MLNFFDEVLATARSVGTFLIFLALILFGAGVIILIAAFTIYVITLSLLGLLLIPVALFLILVVLTWMGKAMDWAVLL